MDEQTPIIEEMEQEEALRAEDETIVGAFCRHQKNAAKETKLAVKALLPDDFKAHGKAAKRSFRQACRVIVDEVSARIEAAEKADDETGPSTTGTTKVKVEVN